MVCRKQIEHEVMQAMQFWLINEETFPLAVCQSGHLAVPPQELEALLCNLPAHFRF